MTSHVLIKNENADGGFKWTRDAKFLGFNEKGFRYIMDSADAYVEDCPSESFSVLKEKEIAEFGEYRTRRMVLDAFRKDVR